MALRTKKHPESIPDLNLRLVAAGTFAVTTTHATIDLGAAFASITSPEVDLYISAIDSTTGDESYTFALHQSSDNFVADDETIASKIIASAGAGDLALIPNAVVVVGTTEITKRYIRLVSTLAGTTPSVTMSVYLGAKY